MRIRSIVQALYWKRPLLAALGCALLVALVAVSRPNVYQSYATLLPPPDTKNIGLGGLGAAAAAMGVALPGADGVDAYYVDILESRMLRAHLCGRSYTFRHATWMGGRPRTYQGTLAGFLADGDSELAIKMLGNMMSAIRHPKTRVVTLRVVTPSRDLSEQVIRDSLAFMQEFLLKRAQERGRNKVRFAEQRLVEAREDLRRVEQTLTAFVTRNRDYTVSTDPEVRLTGLRYEAEYRLKQQLVGSLVVSRDQALLDERNDMPVLSVLDEPVASQRKFGPPRGLFTVAAFVLAFSVTWLLLNRIQLVKWVEGHPGEERA